LGLPADDPTPKLSRPNSSPLPLPSSQPLPAVAHTKRKGVDGDGDIDMSSPDENVKRSKTEPSVGNTATSVAESDLTYMHAQAAASYISFLNTEHLLPPKMPSRAEMEAILLGLRKKALVEEYFGEGET